MTAKKTKTDTKPATVQTPPPRILTVDVSDETLEGTPPRMVKFLRGVGTHTAIWQALAAVGYSRAEHARGWNLLHACSNFAPAPTTPTPVNTPAQEAIGTLDLRDERTHKLLGASLKHRVPTAHEALLRGLTPGTGAESVVYFRALLDRLDALSHHRLAGVSAADSDAALAVIDARGMGAAWREEHRALVSQAESVGSAEAATGDASEVDMADMRARLVEARAFFEEWSEIARTEVKRKDYLILLGLASRKHSDKSAGGTGGGSTGGGSTGGGSTGGGSTGGTH